MSSDTSQQRLAAEDIELVRAMGSRLRQILQGKPYEPLRVTRLDDLGALASLTDRLAKELHLSRERDRQHQADLHQRLAELEQAQATIQTLSTPIVNLFRGVLLMSLVGTLDSVRIAQVTETLLNTISKYQAVIIILDITGVSVIDTVVANALLQTAQAVALLGARVCVCGISPEVAQVIVSLGIDLSRLSPVRDLQAALSHALLVTGHRITSI